MEPWGGHREKNKIAKEISRLCFAKESVIQLIPVFWFICRHEIRALIQVLSESKYTHCV